MARTLLHGQGIDRRQVFALGAAAAGALALGGIARARAEEAAGEGAEGSAEAPDEEPAEEQTPAGGSGETVVVGDIKLYPYEHFRTGGSDGQTYAATIFENANSTFTKYQVAITSCTCRDAALNYRSVMYAELDNTAASPESAIVRWLTFGVDGDYTVGMWGDSSPIPTNPDYTSAYMDEHLVQPLVGMTKADIDAWGGYGTLPGGLDIDAVAGATVTSSNVVSAVQALFAYHAATYYGA